MSSRLASLFGAAVVVVLVGCSPSATADGSVTPAPAEDTATATVASPTPEADTVQVFERVPDLHPSVDGYAAGLVEIVASDDTVHRLPVRLARTSAERAHGLMEVPELPDGTGMWFVYDEDRLGGFWMKNTLVPLDITYVDADGRIVSIAHAEPCRVEDCPTYEPEGPYRTVLEVPGGYLERIGVDVGDTVRLVEG